VKARTFILCALVGGALVAAASWGCSSGGAIEVVGSPPAATSPAAQPKQSPADFATEYVGQAIRGQADRTWETLAQEQRAIISRETFIRCAQQRTLAVPDSVRVTDTYNTTTDIPGTAITGVASTAVTVELSWGSQRQALTIHLVAEDGAWRWSLDADAIRAERAGDCPP